MGMPAGHGGAKLNRHLQSGVIGDSVASAKVPRPSIHLLFNPERKCSHMSLKTPLPSIQLEILQNVANTRMPEIGAGDVHVQNEFFDTVLDSFPHPFYVIDANDYTVLLANSAARTGVSEAKSTCYALTHHLNQPCNTSEHPCPLQEVKRTREPATLEHLHHAEDGSRRNVEVHAHPIFDREGNVAQVIEYFIDITERKRAEEALSQSEQRFRAIFEGTQDCIFLKDPSLRYVQVNPAFERLAGIPASQIIGKTYEDVFGREASDYTRDRDLRALAGDTLEVEQSVTIRGISRSFLVTRTPLRDTSGVFVGILTVLHDITDRKRTERHSSPEQGGYPSKAMRDTLHQAAIVAKSPSTILLTGESGSGKDHLAKYIHDHSDRANGPYFAINCAAIAPELAESELFGYEKGSFTGAVARKRGMLELAEGGTLLLNEIGELSLQIQAKLLTFMDTKRFTRVGGEKEISVSARLIAATNRDLKKALEAGTFRKDLFYRINVVSIAIPALRERLNDIPILVQEILAKICDEIEIHDRPVIGRTVMQALKAYHWPGNVRELRNVLERAVILSDAQATSLPSMILSSINGRAPLHPNERASFCVSFPNDSSLNEMAQELKRFMINEALRRSGGSKVGAAKLLGISRDSLKHYMKALNCAEEK
jgi:PAS domain S-box-containing protein